MPGLSRNVQKTDQTQLRVGVHSPSETGQDELYVFEVT